MLLPAKPFVFSVGYVCTWIPRHISTLCSQLYEIPCKHEDFLWVGNICNSMYAPRACKLCTMMNRFLTSRLSTRTGRCLARQRIVACLSSQGQVLLRPTWLANTPLGLRRFSSRPTSISSDPSRVQQSAPQNSLPGKSWVDRMPIKTRPYLHLTRIDKPIGTLLLFYPCGMSRMRS